MNSLAAWLRDASNLHTIIISFASALVIVFVVNMVYLGRRTYQEYKLVRKLLRHGNTVTLKRELLLSLTSIEKGQSGTVREMLDMPRLKSERTIHRKIAIVDFNGTLVPLDASAARRYLVLDNSPR